MIKEFIIKEQSRKKLLQSKNFSYEFSQKSFMEQPQISSTSRSMKNKFKEKKTIIIRKRKSDETLHKQNGSPKIEKGIKMIIRDCKYDPKEELEKRVSITRKDALNI